MGRRHCCSCRGREEWRWRRWCWSRPEPSPTQIHPTSILDSVGTATNCTGQLATVDGAGAGIANTGRARACESIVSKIGIVTIAIYSYGVPCAGSVGYIVTRDNIII